MKREFHSRTKAFACLLTMCAGFSDAYTFICRGGTLGGRPDGKCGLSIGWFDRPADLRCRSEVSHDAGLYAGIFLMTVLRRLIDNSVWRLSTLVPLYPHNFGDGIFASIGKKCLHSCLFLA